MRLALLARSRGHTQNHGKMKATGNMNWLVLLTSIVLAGALAHEPAVSLAAAIAAVFGVSRRWSPVLAFPTTWRGQAALSRSGAFSTMAFQGLGQGETSPPSSASQSEEDGTTDTAKSRGSQSYEEFTAGLEDDADEEISFMPHYASDTAEARVAGDGSSDVASGRSSLLSDDLREVEGLVSRLPVPRRFALGTVAIIRRLLEPAQVEQILLEQRRYPRLRFGDVAVQLSLLTEGEVQELLVAQEEGIFSDEEISDARRRLAAYHRGGAA